MSIADRIVGVESGGDPYAANPRSTARGAGQFIEATWLDTLAKYRPDLTTGMSREEILALRNDPALSQAMTEAYASENSNVLSRAGVPVTAGTTYLAHFAGPQGAVSILKADPTAPVASVLGEAAVKANPFLSKMTVADLQAWADRKMGSNSQAQPSTPAAPQALPVQNAASFSNAEPVPIQGMNQAAMMPAAMKSFGSLSPEQPLQQPPPTTSIMRRKPLDLSRLRAAFSLRA